MIMWQCNVWKLINPSSHQDVQFKDFKSSTFENLQSVYTEGPALLFSTNINTIDTNVRIKHIYRSHLLVVHTNIVWDGYLYINLNANQKSQSQDHCHSRTQHLCLFLHVSIDPLVSFMTSFLLILILFPSDLLEWYQLHVCFLFLALAEVILKKVFCQSTLVCQTSHRFL